MTQPNIVEGDYTGIDYGTVDDTQTQSSFATGGPAEVIFFPPHPPPLFVLKCVWCFREMLAGGKRHASEEVSGLEPHAQERQQLPSHASLIGVRQN